MDDSQLEIKYGRERSGTIDISESSKEKLYSNFTKRQITLTSEASPNNKNSKQADKNVLSNDSNLLKNPISKATINKSDKAKYSHLSTMGKKQILVKSKILKCSNAKYVN